MILAIVISGFIVGCILSLRFRVFVLGPALLFAAISTSAISSTNGFGGGTIVLAVLAVMISLQCGFVVRAHSLPDPRVEALIAVLSLMTVVDCVGLAGAVLKAEV
jgi:hypothetical protein